MRVFSLCNITSACVNIPFSQHVTLLVWISQDEITDPEAYPRILDNREDYLRLHEHLFTFSTGPRGCMGRELAMASKSFFFAPFPYSH